jgi:hypothetical protein
VRRDDLPELHFIAPIANLASIRESGILSHKRASKVQHTSVAMRAIQERREKVVVPGGRPLHDYVNLYVSARNKMLFKIKGKHAELCVLRISTEVLDLPGAVVSDQNASSKYVRFDPVGAGLARLNRELIFAESWKHPHDQIEEWRHGSIKCAEVLVPEAVDPRFIQGCYVSCEAGRSAVENVAPGFPVTIDGHLAFR